MVEIGAPDMPTPSASQSAPAYPIATIAAYGPDDQCATKLVVAVFATPGASAPVEMRTWRGTHRDLRDDPGTAAEVTQFVTGHGVQRVVSPETILGCPHQEGIDYPAGETCPDCGFWANRKRQVGEAFQGATKQPQKAPAVPAAPTVGRNEPCLCGSGRKFKKCCGRV